MGNKSYPVILLTALLLLSAFLFVPLAHGSSDTYVFLVHGYSFTGSTNAFSGWQSGTDIYQELVNAGYIVGVVSYYGTFTIYFSNGYTFQDPNFVGNHNTPIESIAGEFAYALNTVFKGQNINADIIGHSMGGLVTMYMLENYRLPINLENVISIESPFDGSPFAQLASYLGFITGYQASEMQTGSSFLTNLQNNQYNISLNYPSAVLVLYAGNYDPWWGYLFFSGGNDGVVSDASASDIIYNYYYVFPVLHVSSLDWLTYSGVAYNEYPAVSQTIMNNLAGIY
ncbi:MAG: alpha/beta hydrolase [Thermoplasmatales archaeon]|jgi:pimeloyl-ACP methyl ester carboxylesterase|nr:alpha/beta hydrolase [Thermoplasmatales archaeon]